MGEIEHHLRQCDPVLLRTHDRRRDRDLDGAGADVRGGGLVDTVDHEPVDEPVVLERRPARRHLVAQFPHHLARRPFQCLIADDGAHRNHRRAAFAQQFAHALHRQDRLNRVVGVGRAQHDRLKVGRVQRFQNLVRNARHVRAGIQKAFHYGLALQFGEVLVITHMPVVGDHHRAHGIVAHRQHARLDAQRLAETERDLTERALRPHRLGTQQRQRERAITNTDPMLRAETVQHVVQRVSLASRLPASRGTCDPGQRVQHGVDVGRERQTEDLMVVAGIDDDGEVLAAQAPEPVGELCAAYLTSQCNDCSHCPPHP